MKHKQRVVGVLVLIAIAIIIIFMFSGHTNSKKDQLTLSDNMPATPEKPAMQLAIPPANSNASQQPMATPQSAVTPAAQTSSVVFEPTQGKGSVGTQAQPQAATAPITQTSAVNQAVSSAPNVPTSTQTQTTLPTSSVPSPVNAPTQQAAVMNNGSVTTTETQPAQPPVETRVTPKKVMTHKTQVKKSTVSKTEQKKEKKPQSIAKSVPSAEAWVVQLGSFSDKANVHKLIKQLREKGFSAYTREVKTGQGVLLRVLVGPELRRADADKTAAKLQKTLNIKGMVVRADEGRNKK